MAALTVRLHAGAAPDGLADLASTAGGHFFMTPAWLRAVPVAAAHLVPRVLAVHDAHGKLQAACPLFVASRFGLWRLYAGAWGTYGGIVARDAEAATAARQALERLASAPRVALARVHDFGDSCGDSGFWSAAEEVCQVLDLPADPASLFDDVFTSQNRNKIRKAGKLGVTVRRAQDRAGLEHYADLYAESARRWKLPTPLPRPFFLALADAPGVDVWLAEQAGAPVAGLLNLRWGGQIMNWGNVSRRDAWGASPNNLLHWRAIEAACTDPGGPRLYNFGGSTGLPGVEAFKSAFGAHTRTYRRREHTATWAAWLQRLRRPRARETE